ncbi:unnamed protein product [Peronospora belbahrii]|nr:unnamed protein product [Peronospora belbahrii]
MIGFNRAVHEDTMVNCKYGRLGAPWEFNLRDVFRFCDLLRQHTEIGNSLDSQLHALSYYVNFIYVGRMRSPRDRELISRRFEDFFGVPPMNLSAVSFQISAEFVKIGSALLPRRQGEQNGRVAPPILNFLLRPMEALVHCVNMSWPALLVGPPASGKTSSVRLLASLSGNTLHELGMSAGTDATELLGCFEQVNVGRKLREIKQKIQVIYERVLQQLMLACATNGVSQKKKATIQNKASRLNNTWWALITREKYHSDNAVPQSHKKRSDKKPEAKKLPKGQLDAGIVDLMKSVVSVLQQTDAANEEMISVLAGCMNDIDSVVQLSKSSSIASCFEWVDGALIQAMEKGHWVLLDNVNFCSSSVLDRLNSLMETDGEMLVNECGIIDGKLRVIKPHKNFRIFLAMDPQYGEVSRAMRNRCVEIAHGEEDAPRLDLIKIALACGIPGFALSRAFQVTHERAVTKLKEYTAGTKVGRINRRHLENWSLLAFAEFSRGIEPLRAITESFRRVYDDGFLTEPEFSEEILELFLDAFQAYQQNGQCQRALIPVAAPSTLVCEQSESFMLQRDVAYLEYLILSSQQSENCSASDLQLSWLDPDVSVARCKGAPFPDGSNNLNAWLECVSSRVHRQETTYSQRALEGARDHLSSKSFFGLANANTSLAVILAPFALRRIVEVASIYCNTRIQWSTTTDRLLFALEKIASGVGGKANTLRLVKLLARFLRSMTETELNINVPQKLDETVRHLASLLDRSASLPPMYLPANHSAFFNLQSLVADCIVRTPSRKTDLDNAWNSVMIAQRHFELLNGMEWLIFCEREQYRQVDTLFAASSTTDGKDKRNKKGIRRLGSNMDNLSVLQQSYAVHKYQADRSYVENELTFLVYPLLSAFDAFLADLIRDFSNLIMNPLFFEAVQAAFRDRFEFSIQLRVEVFEWTHFLIHWQWMKKVLLRLGKLIEQHPAEAFGWRSQWNNLLNMVQRVQDAIEENIGCQSRKAVLWKKGGYSLLPSSVDLWKAEYLLKWLSETFMHANLMCFSALSSGESGRPTDGKVDVLALLFGGVDSMEAAMKNGKLDVSPLFYVDIDSRKEVLYALCTFSYLAQEQRRGKTGSALTPKQPHALMAKELFKLPNVLLKKLQNEQFKTTELVLKMTLYLSEIEETSHADLLSVEDGRIGKDTPILLFNMRESARLIDRMVTFQLSPMFEHALARQELQSITGLVRVLNMYRLYKNSMSQARCIELVKDIRDVLQSLEVIIEELLRLGLRNPACFYGYQDIVWCGHELVSLESSSEMIGDHTAKLERFISVLQSHLNGMLFRFHQFLRCNSFNHMDLISLEVFDTRKKLRKANKRTFAVCTDVADHGQVVAGFPRLFQAVQSAVALKNIAEVNLEESMCPTSEVQMRAARLEKVKTHFDTKHAQVGKMTFSTSSSFVRELFIATVLAFESTFLEDSVFIQWKEIHSLLLQFADSMQTFDTNARAKLLKALRTSEDHTFVTLVDVFVAPLVTSLTTEGEGQFSGCRTSAVGESMVLLGLWRFALLLPSSPVDPVTKPLVKKENLLNRLAMLTMNDAASSSIHRLNSSPASSLDCFQNDTRSLRDLYNQVTEVSAHAIQRYQPMKPRSDAAMIDLRDFEMKPVAASIFGELFHDLLRFNTTVMSAEKMLALLCTAKSSKSTEQRKRELLRELIMFQQTSENFLAQLSKKFGDCFRDVLEPVAGAIYCVKEGVALVTWSLHENLQNVSLKQQEKEALALSLVRFPSSLNVKTVGQSWCNIQLMLQTAGKPAWSSLLGAGLSNKRKVEVTFLDVALSKTELLFRETLTTARKNCALDFTAVEMAFESSKALFDLFLSKWQQQKEREEQKRKEEEELFKYKTRQLDLETEEELLEKEYREQFPDYSSCDFQAFLSPTQAVEADAERSDLLTATEINLLITDTIVQRLYETHVKLYAETANSDIAITKDEIVNAFARAFSLALKLYKSWNLTASTATESAVESSGVLAASLVQARLGGTTGSKMSVAPSFQALNSDYIRGIDFHRDPLVKEVILVAEPLQRLMVKVQSLLAQWPDHAILQQMVLIADRIRNFEISSPLVRTLTGVELLLRKAQEWEMYAARAYSISDELGSLSSLVTRWRKLELYSWPHLLYVKEKQHRFMAQKTWISMYSLLTAQFESDAGIADHIDATTKRSQNLQWLRLSQVSMWLFIPLNENRAGYQALSDVARESQAKRREFMIQLFETLDAYIRSCPIGQYETRLLVVYSICAQLFMELWAPSKRRGTSTDYVTTSSKYALANMLYHLYRYYGQHLGYLEREWSALKAPIQRKLVEFVKICRWDEQTYYSLAESAEKSHRKLMKFVRDYDAVLTASMQTVIDASTDNGITKEGGFVGIHLTKKELIDLNDAVVVPVDVKQDNEQDHGEVSVEGETTERAKLKSKVLVEEELQGCERPPVLRLLHTSSHYVVTSEDSSLLPMPAYATKLPALSKRITKYTLEHILSHNQVQHRQQVHVLCEDLCETIFYRILKLQKATGLPKGAKKKALIDLLRELKTQGMAYHRLQLPAEQQQIQRLFELDVPDVENCLHVDQFDSAVDSKSLPTSFASTAAYVSGKQSKPKWRKTKSKETGYMQPAELSEEVVTKNSPMWLWQRADGYYYRFLGQLASLRYSAMTSFSHDLSSSEVERMSGYAENMLHTMLQQRQILHTTSLSHEKLVDGLTSLELMKEFKKNYLVSGKMVVNPKTANEWQSFQLASVNALRPRLRELEISLLQILQQSSETTLVLTEVCDQFQRITERCNAIQKSFAESGGLTRSLGVPSIPYCAVNASEDAGGDTGIVAFARPSKRIYGVSPIVSCVESSSDVSRSVPLATAMLQANSAHFSAIQSLLAKIGSALGTVTIPSCFNEFLAEYADIICVDSKFERTLRFPLSSRGDCKAYEYESTQSMATFSEIYDRLVETVLVSIQDLTKLSTETESTPTQNTAKEADGEAQSLRNQLATLSTMVKDLRVNSIASQLAKLLELLHRQYDQFVSTQSEEWKQVFTTSITLLERFEPTLIDVRGISRQLFVDFLVAHKSVMKLDYVLVRIFRNLFQHGFCRTDEERNNEEGDSDSRKMQFQDDVEGTGMGEGDGKKDVSHEIKDEEQLLGLQGDQQDAPDPSANEQPEDTGFEMQNDFEGAMQNAPDNGKEEDQDDNEDEEELDREMGEFDQDDENVVDEKMWGEDSDDDDDNIDKEKEKFEEDSNVRGETLEDEVRGKEGDEKGNNDSDKEEKDEQKPQLNPSDDTCANDDDDGGEDETMDGDINDDFEDQYEDYHDVDPTEREDGRGEGETEENHGDELPEDMQIDNDEDDEDDGCDADGDDLNDENMEKQNDPADEAADDDAGGKDIASAENKESAEEDSENEQPDKAVQLGGGGLEDEPEFIEENIEEDAEQPDVPESTEEEEQATSKVAGTQSKDGQDELDTDKREMQDQKMEDANPPEQEQSNDDISSTRAQNQRSSNDQELEWKPQSEVDKDLDQEPHRETRRDRREPNPYRNAQEAQDHWKKRVEMVDRTEEEKAADENSSAKQEKASDMTTAEFVDDDEEMVDVEHALAAANENQMMTQPRSEEEKSNAGEEEDEMNLRTEATAPEVEEKKAKESTDEQEQKNMCKPIKQELKPDTDAADDNVTKQEQLDKQEAKPKNFTEDGDHELLDDETDHALPSRLRDLDLTTSMHDKVKGDETEASTVTQLSPEEAAALRDELDSFIAKWSSQSEQERGAELWAKYTTLTAGASQRLCEQLRLVLEPMLRAKLEGDFRTGKRINMRKVIPYIASQFRKDKIWLRRTRPSKRQYQVMLAIDDSESMADSHAGHLALEALATLCKAMTQLEVGELSVVKFGQDVELLHAFDMPFTDDVGSRLIGRFGFQQKKTNMVQTLDTILQLLETAKQLSSATSSAVEFTQIVFLISDGRFDSDGRVRIRKLIETALERQQLIVLLIVDQGAAENSSNQQQTSILDTQSVTFDKGKVRMVPYLENYPFPYYVLLPVSTMLPEILSDSLRQWFEMLQAKN